MIFTNTRVTFLCLTFLLLQTVQSTHKVNTSIDPHRYHRQGLKKVEQAQHRRKLGAHEQFESFGMGLTAIGGLGLIGGGIWYGARAGSSEVVKAFAAGEWHASLNDPVGVLIGAGVVLGIGMICWFISC